MKKPEEVGNEERILQVSSKETSRAVNMDKKLERRKMC